jgi:hypothetical protein
MSRTVVLTMKRLDRPLARRRFPLAMSRALVAPAFFATLLVLLAYPIHSASAAEVAATKASPAKASAADVAPTKASAAKPAVSSSSASSSEVSSGAPAGVTATSDAASPKPSAADRAAAQVLFDEGRELMEQGRAADACPRFEESERLEPGLGTRFHLAACYEALGKLASAHALFLSVAAEAASRSQPAREKVARERAQAVEPRLARLTIEVPFSPSPALRITRDGAAVGTAQWGLPVPVDPGVHHVDASAPGYESWSTDVEVPREPGVTRVNVPPLAERRPAFFEPLSRKLGLAALGVGAGTIALGSVFVAQAISKKNASDRAGCSERDCRSQTGLSLRREALQAGDRATWAMGIGLVGLGAAAALFWVLPPSSEQGGDDSDVQLSPVADLSSASLRLNGRF